MQDNPANQILSSASPQISMNSPSSSPPQVNPPPIPEFKTQPPKPSLLPILIFVFLGVLTALLVALYLQFKAPSQMVTVMPTVAPVKTPPLSLVIDSPTDKAIVVDDKLSLKGRTLPKTTVVVYTDNYENIVESDINGVFETDLVLVDGINPLTITAFGSDGDEKTVNLDVIYDAQT